MISSKLVLHFITVFLSGTYQIPALEVGKYHQVDNCIIESPIAVEPKISPSLYCQDNSPWTVEQGSFSGFLMVKSTQGIRGLAWMCSLTVSDKICDNPLIGSKLKIKTIASEQPNITQCWDLIYKNYQKFNNSDDPHVIQNLDTHVECSFWSIDYTTSYAYTVSMIILEYDEVMDSYHSYDLSINRSNFKLGYQHKHQSSTYLWIPDSFFNYTKGDWWMYTEPAPWLIYQMEDSMYLYSPKLSHFLEKNYTMVDQFTDITISPVIKCGILLYPGVYIIPIRDFHQNDDLSPRLYSFLLSCLNYNANHLSQIQELISNQNEASISGTIAYHLSIMSINSLNHQLESKLSKLCMILTQDSHLIKKGLGDLSVTQPTTNRTSIIGWFNDTYHAYNCTPGLIGVKTLDFWFNTTKEPDRWAKNFCYLPNVLMVVRCEFLQSLSGRILDAVLSSKKPNPKDWYPGLRETQNTKYQNMYASLLGDKKSWISYMRAQSDNNFFVVGNSILPVSSPVIPSWTQKFTQWCINIDNILRSCFGFLGFIIVPLLYAMVAGLLLSCLYKLCGCLFCSLKCFGRTLEREADHLIDVHIPLKENARR